MTDPITIPGQSDHVQHWSALKRFYIINRGSDASKLGKAIPRTTYGDVESQTQYWNTEFRRELLRYPFLNDRSQTSGRQWVESKTKLDQQMVNADRSAVYPDNEWFWDTAVQRLAIYLESRKAIPSSTELMLDAVTETMAEHAQAAKDLAKGAATAVADAGRGLLSTIKTGALIVGGLVGVAIVAPPIIRAFREPR